MNGVGNGEEMSYLVHGWLDPSGLNEGLKLVDVEVADAHLEEFVNKGKCWTRMGRIPTWQVRCP